MMMQLKFLDFVILQDGLIRTNETFRGFQVFHFAIYSKPKTQKSRKVLFYFKS